MEIVWKFIEKHHQQFGAALFIIPMLLCAGALIGVGCVLAWAFR